MWKVSCCVLTVLIIMAALAEDQSTPAPGPVIFPPPADPPDFVFVPLRLQPTKGAAGFAFLKPVDDFFHAAANMGRAVWDFLMEPYRVLAAGDKLYD
ncbi:hypothetical protein RRG08_007367 [Elysia crispata]|uniref:Uncharacterized protein n=1 Tax=Elysia crispata TaxID=231223 RepID=A0AAE1AR23_9GAST|nr:hypothetical protein RRG08_007367 [Elysia crispata]